MVVAAVGEAEEEEEAVAEAVVVAVGGEEGFRRKIAIEVLFVFFSLPDMCYMHTDLITYYSAEV